MIRALFIALAADPNGEAMRYKAAAERHGGAHIRSVARSAGGYRRHQVDVQLSGNRGAINRLWEQADVVHLTNRPEAYDEFADGRERPAVLHHHGARFRTDPEPLLARAARSGWAQAASTLDLAEIAPDVVTWLPTPFDLDALAMIRAEHRRPADGTIRIVHAPTFKQVKGTDAVIAAVDQLIGEGLPVELDLVERTAWSECLRRKAAADIFIDQLYLGYGCNAIEAWGMGIPVVAGIDPEAAEAVNHPIPTSTRDRMLREFDGVLPFAEASAETLADVLRPLVEDPELRATWALSGMEHVQRFHAQLPALERLVGLYQAAINPGVSEAVA